MEMTDSHLTTLLIWRVFIIGNKDTQTRVRDRVLSLVKNRVRGMEGVPKKAILFRPREKLLDVVRALPATPDALFVVPQGTQVHFPEVYDGWLLGYREMPQGIELIWSPSDGGVFSVSSSEDGDAGPHLPLAVTYWEPGRDRTAV